MPTNLHWNMPCLSSLSHLSMCCTASWSSPAAPICWGANTAKKGLNSQQGLQCNLVLQAPHPSVKHWGCSPAPQKILNQHHSILKIKLNLPGRDSLFLTLFTKTCQAVPSVSKKGRNVWYTLLKIKALLVGSDLFSRGWEEAAILLHIASTFCIPLDEAVEAPGQRLAPCSWTSQPWDL